MKNGRSAQPRTVELARSLVRTKEGVTGASLELAVSVAGLGAVYADRGEWVPAMAAYKRALAIRRAGRPPDPVAIADSEEQIARVLILKTGFPLLQSAR